MDLLVKMKFCSIQKTTLLFEVESSKRFEINVRVLMGLVVMGYSFLLFCFLSTAMAWADPTWEGVPTGYGLAWSDEFNGTVGSAPNSANWGYDTGTNGGWGNGETEKYTNSTANSQIVSDPNATDGESLAIIALDTGVGSYTTDGRFTSARINTSGKQLYGASQANTYYVARIRMPYEQGTWPAFWSLGGNFGSVGWPTCGETDIMENFGAGASPPPVEY